MSVLALLFGRPGEKFYFRSVLRAVHTGHGAVQRELKSLCAAGIIRRTVSGRQVYYQADPDSPIYPELRGLVAKTAGLGDILNNALLSLGSRIQIAFVYGSAATGEFKNNSDIDLCVIGDASFSDVVEVLRGAQEAIGREINPTVYSAAEFRSKVRAKHHFVTSLLRGERIFLIGDSDELEGLASKRLGRRT
jgi:predicted nucleotidyltransferase